MSEKEKAAKKPQPVDQVPLPVFAPPPEDPKEEELDAPHLLKEGNAYIKPPTFISTGTFDSPVETQVRASLDNVLRHFSDTPVSTGDLPTTTTTTLSRKISRYLERYTIPKEDLVRFGTMLPRDLYEAFKTLCNRLHIPIMAGTSHALLHFVLENRDKVKDLKLNVSFLDTQKKAICTRGVFNGRLCEELTGCKENKATCKYRK